MNNIIRLLPKLLDASSGNHEFAESVARIAWTRGIGEGLRPHAVPERLAGDTLVVAVTDVGWRTQLRAMSAELLARVNWIIGRDLIKSIEFRVDPKTVETMRSKRPQTDPGLAERALNSVPMEIMTAAQAIQDEGLRRRFLLAAGAATMRRQAS